MTERCLIGKGTSPQKSALEEAMQAKNIILKAFSGGNAWRHAEGVVDLRPGLNFTYAFGGLNLNPEILESSSSSWSCSSSIQWASAPRKEPDFPATILFRWFNGETIKNLKDEDDDEHENEFLTSEFGLKFPWRYAHQGHQISQPGRTCSPRPRITIFRALSSPRAMRSITPGVSSSEHEPLMK
jgi:hypothetical protein